MSPNEDASLWWARLLMLALGLAVGQVFVPVQAAAFATITPEATGRAATMFNTVRQLGGAIGVAVLTMAIVAIGPVHIVSGHPVANLIAYRIAFEVAAAIALIGTTCSLSIRDSDAARTITGRRAEQGSGHSSTAAASHLPGNERCAAAPQRTASTCRSTP